VLLNCDPNTWTKLLIFNSTCKPYVALLGWTQSSWSSFVSPSDGCVLVYMRDGTSTKANALTGFSLKPGILQILNSPVVFWLPTQSPGSCRVTVGAGDVNVRLKVEHYACRMTFAAIPVSKAVMCQPFWERAVSLPKIFLCLKRVWRACPAEQSHAIQWAFT